MSGELPASYISPSNEGGAMPASHRSQANEGGAMAASYISPSNMSGAMPASHISPSNMGGAMKTSYISPVSMSWELPAGLGAYLIDEVLPRYGSFDAAHREGHALAVVRRSLQIGVRLGARAAMLCVAAVYHDLGLCDGREVHHLSSGRILRADERLRRWFSPAEVELMAEAVEDHRASAAHEPRSLYGRILAEADRLIDPLLIMERTLQFGLSHYPELTPDLHVERALEHLREKYGPRGYLRLWIPGSDNERHLHELWRMMDDEPGMRLRLRNLFDQLTG